MSSLAPHARTSKEVQSLRRDSDPTVQCSRTRPLPKGLSARSLCCRSGAPAFAPSLLAEDGSETGARLTLTSGRREQKAAGLQTLGGLGLMREAFLGKGGSGCSGQHVGVRFAIGGQVPEGGPHKPGPQGSGSTALTMPGLGPR